MKNTVKTLLLICLLPLSVLGQSKENNNNSPISVKFNKNSELIVSFSDMENYIQMQDSEPFYRFARPISLDLDIKSFSKKTYSSLDSTTTYNFTLKADDALSLNAVFNINDWSKIENIRVFDEVGVLQFSKTNFLDQTSDFWSSEIIEGSALSFEFVQSYSSTDSPIFLNQVNYGFRSFNGNFNGSCDDQVDVTCSPERDNWLKEINSSCLIRVNDQGFCSGAVINNTIEDGRPYVLTANHCFASFAVGEGRNNAALNSRFLFNYESQWCQGPQVTNWDEMQGATIVAQWDETDFLLLELNQQIPTEFYTYYSGWDRLDNQPPTGVGIHHPAGDVKKIATHSQPLVVANCMTTTPIPSSNPVQNFASNNNFFRVSTWDVTPNGNSKPEGGSSGSPLYNANKRIVGQLFGADCGLFICTDSLGNRNRTSDEIAYGRISMSWLGNGTTNSSLSNWLDPIGLAPSDYFGLRWIRYYTVDHNAWFTGDVVKFHDVNVLPGHDVVVTELQDRFEATGTLDIPAGVTFRVDKP